MAGSVMTPRRKKRKDCWQLMEHLTPAGYAANTMTDLHQKQTEPWFTELEQMKKVK